MGHLALTFTFHLEVPLPGARFITSMHDQSTYRAAECRTRMTANKAMSCTVAGCTTHRHLFSQHCQSHWRRARFYGDPLQSPISPKVYAQELAEVRALFKGNQEHPGLVTARAHVDALMSAAVEATRSATKAKPMDQEMGRLARHGVSSLEVLEMACALWAYQTRNPHACRTDKAWTYALGRAVFACAPRPRRGAQQGGPEGSTRRGTSLPPSGAAVEALGGALRDDLGPLLVNVCQSLKSEQQRELDRLAAMREAFK